MTPHMLDLVKLSSLLSPDVLAVKKIKGHRLHVRTVQGDIHALTLQYIIIAPVQQLFLKDITGSDTIH